MAITLAMSGGVDSSAAAFLLRQGGRDPQGVTFVMFPGGEGPGAAAAEVCRTLGMEHRVIDASAAFRATVIRDFIDEYAAGRTPNPCVVCNRCIKFPMLLDAAGDGAIATGHYAKVIRCGSRWAIARGADRMKDQSYMLWQLPQETLSRLVLPLGEYTKAEIRAIAAEAGLPGASAGDSQDICFIPDGDYVGFLARAGVDLAPGVYVDEDGAVLGRAQNQAAYTIGQRKGLGIALGRPMYVARREAEGNRVTLTAQDPYSRTVAVRDIRYMAAAPGDLDRPRRLAVKVRYARGEQACTVVADGGRLYVEMDEPVRAAAPGQSAVVYDGDTVVCGGIVE